MYRHFVKRLQYGRAWRCQPIDTAAKGRRRDLNTGTVGIFTTGGIVILIPLLLVGSSLSYFGYIFGVLAGPLLAALIIAFVWAYRSFAAVEQQAFATVMPLC